MARRGFDFVDLLSNAQALELILFACPDGVIVTNAEDEVVLYAGASEDLFGFPPIEVMHRPVARLFEDQAAYDQFREDLAGEGCIVSRELPALRADGAPFSAAVSAAPLRERDGSALGAVFYVRDYGDSRLPRAKRAGCNQLRSGGTEEGDRSAA